MSNIYLICHVSFAAILTVSITGCANNPIPLKEPSEYSKDNIKNQPDKTDGGLDPATTHGDLIRALELYEESYKNTAINFRTQTYASGDGTALGAIVGVIGGIFEKSGAIYGGAGLAAASSMYSQRYQFDVQAHNYRQAYDAMKCLRVNVLPYATIESSQITEVNEKINKIRDKLFDAQWRVELMPPDVDALKLALENSQAAARKKKMAETEQFEAEAREQMLSKNIEKNNIKIAELRNGKPNLAEEAQDLAQAYIVDLESDNERLRDEQITALAKVASKKNEASDAEIAERMAKLDECIEAT